MEYISKKVAAYGQFVLVILRRLPYEACYSLQTWFRRVFVLVRELYSNKPSNKRTIGLGQFWLWNPVSGQHFSTTQTFLPLQSVWILGRHYI